jgi:pimeloyl-ACP methyl ester carboxylesterase
MSDTRGTGDSADASDPLSYRCDRLVGDVEALRAHLSLDRMDLLGHSAAGNLATLYAAAYPERVAHLILLTPALDAVGSRRLTSNGARRSPAGPGSRGIQRR